LIVRPEENRILHECGWDAMFQQKKFAVCKSRKLLEGSICMQQGNRLKRTQILDVNMDDVLLDGEKQWLLNLLRAETTMLPKFPLVDSTKFNIIEAVKVYYRKIQVHINSISMKGRKKKISGAGIHFIKTSRASTVIVMAFGRKGPRLILRTKKLKFPRPAYNINTTLAYHPEDIMFDRCCNRYPNLSKRGIIIMGSTYRSDVR